ncbi:hypothetical protein MBCUR_09710 [Methanobrevibacter curvatus]|jgi:hypothetical protein|uniref:Uncharacterized protein n=2 Tax=Methanobrevibacter curvatus TaxID=49547 RepID=A0A166AYT0_9EURY|nr:hypothetical protein MBCUR_09710 [Methanobrevibacter curvatus]MDR3063635.1 hypothetical protein [Methanobrevibacter sp.]
MCGFEFDETKIGKSCQGCGKKECSTVHCPNCGHGNSPEFEQEFKFVDILKERLKSKK